MKRIVWAAVAGWAALLAGCNSAHLALGQNSQVNVPVGTTYAFQGIVQDSNGIILWNLTGPGSLTDASGPTTVYIAPSTYDPANKTATLTASISDAPDAKQVVTITITKPSSTTSGIPNLTATVNVTYDERDIPTINCTKSVDCYAVLGYIHARDRFFQMDFYRRAAEGTLSELIGFQALPIDEVIRTLFTARTGGRMLDGFYAHVKSDPELAGILAAYTAGVNTWLGQMRASATLPSGYEQILYPINPASPDDIRDWSDVDTLAVARLFEFRLSEDVTKEADLGRWAKTFAADPVAVGV